MVSLKIMADLHTHTCHSHGKGTVFENAKAGKERGLEIVGISDHGPGHFFGVGIRKPEVLRQIKQEAQEASEKLGIQVQVGVEANIIGLDGTLDLPGEMIRELDYVLVGLHWLVWPKGIADGWQFLVRNGLARYWPPMASSVRRANTQALIKAVDRYTIKAITHPGLRMPIETGPLAKACAQRGTLLEINASHRQQDVAFLAECKAAGASFLISSDAHEPGRVGDVQWALDLAEKASLTPEDIWNCRKGDSG